MSVHDSLCIYVVTDNTKVLLYNFFKDSTATLSQWRLVLNGISDGNDLLGAPAFDETRHTSICVEVCCLWPELFSLSSLIPSGSKVEILVRCDYSGSEEPLDRGQF